MNDGRAPRLLSAYYMGLLALLYVPIGMLFLFSIHSNTVLSFPLRALTLDWYAKLLQSAAILEAARNSLVVAAGSSFAATLLGTMVSILALRYDFRGKAFLITLAALPLIVPYIILGVALLILFSVLGVNRGLWTVGVAHTVVSLPYVLLIVSSRLASFETSLEEAAMDLGATYLTTLRRIVLPVILPAVVSAWLTSFTVSFDEFALALFLAGTAPTFPVYLYSQLRFASRLPIMIAMAVLMMVGTLALILLSERIRSIRD